MQIFNFFLFLLSLKSLKWHLNNFSLTFLSFHLKVDISNSFDCYFNLSFKYMTKLLILINIGSFQIKILPNLDKNYLILQSINVNY